MVGADQLHCKSVYIRSAPFIFTIVKIMLSHDVIDYDDDNKCIGIARLSSFSLTIGRFSHNTAKTVIKNILGKSNI